MKIYAIVDYSFYILNVKYFKTKKRAREYLKQVYLKEKERLKDDIVKSKVDLEYFGINDGICCRLFSDQFIIRCFYQNSYICDDFGIETYSMFIKEIEVEE